MTQSERAMESAVWEQRWLPVQLEGVHLSLKLCQVPLDMQGIAALHVPAETAQCTLTALLRPG